MAQLSAVSQNSYPVSTSIFNNVDPYFVSNAGWGPSSQSGYSKIANSLRGLYVNKEALDADADNRRNEPFVGTRASVGGLTHSPDNYDLTGAYNKFIADEYNWTSNPKAASSAVNYAASRRNAYHNPNYGGVTGTDSNMVDGNSRIGFGTGHRDPPQRADPIIQDGYTKRQSHATRSVYPAQFNDYLGYSSDKVNRQRREQEMYIDEGIALKYARDRVANISSSHHAFQYRDPYASTYHQPYVEANMWLNYPNL